jgi:hypothetical protein
MIKKDAITHLINTAWDATEASKVGKIIRDADPEKHIVNVNTIPYQVFLSVLGSIIPHDISTELKEPPEPWKGE